MTERKLIAALRALHDGGVELVLVGGLAAVLNGAPVDTFDVDVVHSRDPANVARLLPVLAALDALFRIQCAETLIAIEEELAGEKDRAMLHILRRTLEEKRKRELQ
jgi:hypothetical protein